MFTFSVVAEFVVVRPEYTVDEGAEAVAQQAPRPLPVVVPVVELEAGPPLVPLLHAVAQQSALISSFRAKNQTLR